MVLGFLVARQGYCILGNLSINELLNLHRYQYMQRDDGSVYNRFDRGPVANCMQFWHRGHMDWEEMFHEERLVCTHADPCPVCSKVYQNSSLYIWMRHVLML